MIPIYFDADEEYYNTIITKINGLLFTGGTYDFGNNTWTLNAAYLYKKIIEANNNGIHIPVNNICIYLFYSFLDRVTREINLILYFVRNIFLTSIVYYNFLFNSYLPALGNLPRI